jgi:hypothetical protein
MENGEWRIGEGGTNIDNLYEDPYITTSRTTPYPWIMR